MGVQRRRRGVALQEVDRGQEDEQQARDQRSDEDPVRRQPAGGEHASGGDQHGRPEQDDDHHGRVEAAVRQARREHVRQGARDVGEQRRVVEGRLGELTPNRDEAHPGRDPLRHPVVDAARPARGELGRHERRRQQERDRGQDVERHRGETEDGRRGRGAEIAYRPQGQHRHRQPAERRLRPGRRTNPMLGRRRIRQHGSKCHLCRGRLTCATAPGETVSGRPAPQCQRAERQRSEAGGGDRHHVQQERQSKRRRVDRTRQRVVGVGERQRP